MLAIGLTAIAVSIVGAAVGSTPTAGPGWWGGGMFGSGHMGGWSAASNAADPIEGAREIVVTATDFAFFPAELSVGVGEAVNLTLVNEGELPHDLLIPDLGVRVAANPGRSGTSGFIATNPGSFQLVCAYPGHADSGMTGTLLVIEDID